jgi:RNA polymerase sigma factor for flagellar operon FliA
LRGLASIYLTSLDGLHEIPDDSLPHPDDELERSRLAERVRAAMATLPEIERRVVELYYYQDLSFSEIGVRLGICKPWAFRLHRKATRQLRELLSALDESAVPASG